VNEATGAAVAVRPVNEVVRPVNEVVRPVNEVVRPVNEAAAADVPTEGDWSAALGVIRQCQEAGGTVLVSGHLNPDADALGCALAVGHGLRRLGVGVQVTCGASAGAPFDPPTGLADLPGADAVVDPRDVTSCPDLIITTDTGSADRLGVLADLVADALADGRPVLVIDHHRSNTRYGSHHLLDVTAPATAVVVDELLRRLQVGLDQQIAACLYAAVSSDTGSFRYASTTAATHEFAARLLRTGIPHDTIARKLYDTRPFGALGLFADVLAAAVLEPAAAAGSGLVWSTVTAAGLGTRGLGPEAAESVIDLIRTSDEAEVAMVLKELPTGEWSVSLRSKGQVDVGAICTALGGGGHRFAAGFTAAGPVSTVVGVVRDRLAGVVLREP
jgi:phosphoesterase RecJ-like protein